MFFFLNMFQYIFTDVANKCVFTTDDAGHNFNTYCNLPFRPKKLSQNSVNPSMVLGMDDDDPAKQVVNVACLISPEHFQMSSIHLPESLNQRFISSNLLI